MSERISLDSETQSPLHAAFGLDTDPFCDHPSDLWFYADPVVMQRIDLLLHLLQFGDTLILVQGPEGSGKSTLLQQLRRRLPESWQASVLHGSQIHSDAELIAALGHDFPEVRQESGETFAEALMRHAQTLQQQGRLAVVLVDDADRLDDRALSALLTPGGDVPATCRHLRILLLGGPDLGPRLIRLGLHRPQAGSLQSLEMPRFDEQQCAAYLMYRLAVAGYSGESPFTATEIRALYKRSEGRPGALNALASEALRAHAEQRHAGRVPASPHARRLLGTRRLPRAVWAGAAVTLLAVGSLLWVWERGNRFPESTEKAIPLPLPPSRPPEETNPPAATERPAQPDGAHAPGPSPATVEAPPVPPENPPQTIPADAAPPGPDRAEAGPQTSASRPGAESPGAAPEAPPAPESTPEAAPRPVPRPEPRDTHPPSAEARPEAAARPSAPSAAEGGTAPTAARTAPPRREKPAQLSFDQWLAKQPAKHYTLQLLGVKDRRAAERFLDESGLDPATTGIVETRYRGRPWYVVIHGSFPDRAAARAAIEKLPPRLRRNKPWPRTFESL